MKRRALKAEEVGVSTKNEKYKKYLVEIKEKDGSISKIPVYGTDMQDALSRIVRHERFKNIQKSLDKLIVIGIILIIVVVTLILK